MQGDSPRAQGSPIRRSSAVVSHKRVTDLPLMTIEEIERRRGIDLRIEKERDRRTDELIESQQKQREEDTRSNRDKRKHAETNIDDDKLPDYGGNTPIATFGKET